MLQLDLLREEGDQQRGDDEAGEPRVEPGEAEQTRREEREAREHEEERQRAQRRARDQADVREHEPEDDESADRCHHVVVEHPHERGREIEDLTRADGPIVAPQSVRRSTRQDPGASDHERRREWSEALPNRPATLQEHEPHQRHADGERHAVRGEQRTRKERERRAVTKVRALGVIQCCYQAEQNEHAGEAEADEAEVEGVSERGGKSEQPDPGVVTQAAREQAEPEGVAHDARPG